MRPVSFLIHSCLLASAAFLGGCSEDSGPRKITETREASIAPGSYKVGASSQERFGGDQFTSGHGATAHGGSTPSESDPHSDPHSGGGGQDELDYDLPAGWVELPPSEMRRVNVRPAGNPEAECYLTVTGGGVPANVNRWRKQFGIAEARSDEMPAPTEKFFDFDAVRVELEGTFASGMAGAPAQGKPDFALLGLIFTAGDQTVTLKFVGPKAVVAAEKENFTAFARSLRFVKAGTASAAPPAEAPKSGLQFATPEGWTREPDRSTRVATLKPPGTKSTECSIIQLPGHGGGPFQNIARWREQMSLPPLTPSEFDALKKVPMLGEQALVVDWTGQFNDSMTARTIPDARFLGALAFCKSYAVFVKLTGPKDEIDEKVREQFLSLCASLKE